MVWREPGHLCVCGYLYDHLYGGYLFCPDGRRHEQLSDCAGLFRSWHGDSGSGSGHEHCAGPGVYFYFSHGRGGSGHCHSDFSDRVLRFRPSGAQKPEDAGASGLGRLSVEDGPENRRLWPVAVSDYRQRQYSSDCAEHGASALWGAWRRRHPGDLRDDCTELSSAYYNAHGRDYAGKPAGYQLQLWTGGRGPYQKSPALHRGPLPRLLRLYDGDNLYGLSAVCVSVHERRGNRGAFSPLYQDFYGHDHSACGAVSPGG